MTENELRNFYVNTAKEYIGVVKGSAKHGEIVKLYNSIKPLPVGYTLKTNDDWCAAFVSAIAQKCKLTDIIYPECGCNRMITLYKNNGRWIENDAYVSKPGDILFYDWQDSGIGDNTGSPDHVGIVCSVSNGTITVIEGNTSGGKVAYRTIAVNGRYIRGFGIPNYASKGEAIKQENTAPAKQHPTLCNGNSGAAVKEMQQKLIALGYSCGKKKDDGDFGACTEKAVVAFQEDHGLKPDGVCGVLTWAELDETKPTAKTIDSIAREVIAGKWGVGSERKRKLTQAGYDYNAVQIRVNQLLKK